MVVVVAFRLGSHALCLVDLLILGVGVAVQPASTLGQMRTCRGWGGVMPGDRRGVMRVCPGYGAACRTCVGAVGSAHKRNCACAATCHPILTL